MSSRTRSGGLFSMLRSAPSPSMATESLYSSRRASTRTSTLASASSTIRIRQSDSSFKVCLRRSVDRVEGELAARVSPARARRGPAASLATSSRRARASRGSRAGPRPAAARARAAVAGRLPGAFSRQSITSCSRRSGTGCPETLEGRSGAVRTWSMIIAIGLAGEDRPSGRASTRPRTRARRCRSARRRGRRPPAPAACRPASR